MLIEGKPISNPEILTPFLVKIFPLFKALILILDAVIFFTTLNESLPSSILTLALSLILLYFNCVLIGISASAPRVYSLPLLIAITSLLAVLILGPGKSIRIAILLF